MRKGGALVFVRLDVGAQDRVHTCQMTVALFLEPVEYVAVNAKVDRGLAMRHDDAGVFPKIVTEGRGLRRVGACLACAAGDFPFDRAKRISHGSIFLRHAGLLSSH